MRSYALQLGEAESAHAGLLAADMLACFPAQLMQPYIPQVGVFAPLNSEPGLALWVVSSWMHCRGYGNKFKCTFSSLNPSNPFNSCSKGHKHVITLQVRASPEVLAGTT